MRNLLLLITLFLIGCKNSDDYLERIYVKENWEYDGILFLTESANVPRISDESLKYYVTGQELKLALDSFPVSPDLSNDDKDNLYDRPITFKDYGQIYKNSNFTLNTILKTDTSGGRSYRFQLRTYDKNRILIDSFLFAAWDEPNTFISGELSKNLEVKRMYHDSGAIEYYKLLNNGKFQKLQKE